MEKIKVGALLAIVILLGVNGWYLREISQQMPSQERQTAQHVEQITHQLRNIEKSLERAETALDSIDRTLPMIRR